MATRDFQASWADVYNRQGGWSKKHSNHPLRTGGGSGTDWHSIIRIPDSVREALNSSTSSTTLSMRIYFTTAANEIDIGSANHANSRSVGSTGLPQYSYNETWRSIGTGWREYGMSNWFMPRVANGTVRNIVLYSFNGQFTNVATGVGQSAHVRFRVTGTWGDPIETSSVSISGGAATMGRYNDLFIRINRSSSSLTHDLSYSYGSKSGSIASNITWVDHEWTVPLDLATEITEGTTRSGTITCTTKQNGSVIGTSTTSFTAIVPDNSNTKPNITNFSVSIAGSDHDSSINKYIQGITRPRVSFSSSGNYGAYIVSERIFMEGSRYNFGTGSLNRVRGSGTITIRVEATDSRGFTSESTQNITVHAYSEPSVSEFSARRSSGTNVSITRTGTFTSLGGDNTLQIRVYKRPTGQSWWDSVNTGSSTSGTFDSTITSSGNTETLSWEFRLEVEDSFGRTSPAEASVGTIFMPFSIHPRFGISAGKTWERGAFDGQGEFYHVGSMELETDMTVSGSMKLNGSDVATKADMSTGSNANGTWWRFDNGVQISISRYNAVRTESSFTVDLPVSFVDSYGVTLSLNNSDNWAMENLQMMSAGRNNESRVLIRRFGTPNSGLTWNTQVTITVIGRWK